MHLVLYQEILSISKYLLDVFIKDLLIVEQIQQMYTDL